MNVRNERSICIICLMVASLVSFTLSQWLVSAMYSISMLMLMFAAGFYDISINDLGEK